MSDDEYDIDLSTPAGRAKADQYLADVSHILDTVVARVATLLAIKRAHNYDRTATAVELIVQSQNDPRPDAPHLLAMAVHRLAVAELDSPETGSFNGRLLPSGETEMVLKLPPGAIQRGDPPYKHLRIMAAELLNAADEQERTAGQ